MEYEENAAVIIRLPNGSRQEWERRRGVVTVTFRADTLGKLEVTWLRAEWERIIQEMREPESDDAATTAAGKE